MLITMYRPDWFAEQLSVNRNAIPLRMALDRTLSFIYAAKYYSDFMIMLSSGERCLQFTSIFQLMHFIPEYHYSVKYIYKHRLGFIDATGKYFLAQLINDFFLYQPL